MVVVHVVEAWKGGIASYVSVLIKDQLARGYQVYVLADKKQLDADSREMAVPVVAYRSSRKPWRFASIAAEIAGHISELKADVVHCHSTFPGLYVRLRAHNARVVYTPHSWSFFKQDVGALVRAAYKIIEKHLAKKCDAVVCMSMEEISAAARAGIQSDRLRLVYSGIPALPAGCEELPTAPESGPLKVGFFGRFDYQKGFDLLEEVAPLLGDQVELHVFGGAVRGDAAPLSPRFVNHGWVDHKRIAESMSSMDVILIPSRWEGFALTPLEAMRVGRPVIISNQSSLPEAVVHGFNGLILSDFSSRHLKLVLEGLSRSECRRMGENASRLFEQAFRFEDFLSGIDRVYRD